MTRKQILLVKESYNRLLPRRGRLAARFVAELLAREPSLRPLLPREPAAQGAKLVEALAAIVASLDRLHAIAPALEWLALRNAARGLGERHYEAVAETLLRIVEEGLGDALTIEVSDAWAAATREVTALMLQAVESEPLAA